MSLFVITLCDIHNSYHVNTTNLFIYCIYHIYIKVLYIIHIKYILFLLKHIEQFILSSNGISNFQVKFVYIDQENVTAKLNRQARKAKTFAP